MSAPPSLVFDRVTVVDVEQGKLLPNRRVVITGNRIQAVGSTTAVKVPRGAQVVDARGKYLIPGLWDLHTHRGTSSSADAAAIDYLLPLANGVTGIRDAYSDYVPLDLQVKWWKEILAGARVGPPRQLLAGAVLNSVTARFGELMDRGALKNMNRQSAQRVLDSLYANPIDLKIAQRLVDSLKAAGANFIKVYPFGSTVAVAARRAGLQFGGHVEPPVTAVEASDSGISIIDHQYPLFKLCLSSAAIVEQCREVANRFRRNGTWWVPTLIRSDSQGPARPGPASRAVMRRLGELARHFWADSMSDGNWLRGTLGSKVDSTGVLRIAHRVGMPILAGTDVDGTTDLLRRKPKGFALHAELAIYVAEGLTPVEALRTATLNPAKMLHATDSLGTVAVGKLADLVLLDADPLVDITNTTTIRAVIANGRYFDRAALDGFLAEVRAKAKEAAKVP